MCGLIGINEKNKELVNKAAMTFSYRGPDATCFFEDNFVTLGHHRLSIIDVDSRSNQPMSDSKGSVEVVFNGEIYNFLDIKNQLSSKYVFNTSSDTEVIIYGYKEWGADVFSKLQGMFAIAIYDKEKGKIVIGRDHQGIKPLYYFIDQGLFIFSSEIKGITSILKDKKIDLILDQKSIDLYFALGYIPSPYTLYEKIKKLSPANYLEFDLQSNNFNIRGYQPDFKKITDIKDFYQLIDRKVLDHLIADVPVGVFFSGGTDSSLITAILHANKIDLETFSIRLSYKTQDDKYFTTIGNHLNLKKNVYDFGVEELDDIYEEVMSRLDEPTYDNSIFPTYFVSKQASKKVKVVLSGEGGDEFFYGYPRSLVLSRLNSKVDYKITWLDRLFLLLPEFKSKNHWFQKIFALVGQPLSYYLLQMSPSRDKASLIVWKTFKDECFVRKLKPLDLDKTFYLEGDLLRKTDLATSYVSIEGRVPLLDVDIIKNADNFEDLKLKSGELKFFLKEKLLEYLPSDMVFRTKSGFGIDMVYLFEHSKYLKRDLEKSLMFFKSKNDIKIPTVDLKDVNKYPHLCFAIISLYRSLNNL